MRDITFEKVVNVDALDAELKQALGEMCVGVSTRTKRAGKKDSKSRVQVVTVHLHEGVVDADVARVEAIVEAHDHKTLSKGQARRRDLKALRDGAMLIDPADFNGQVKALAEAVRVLQMEVAGLRRE